MKLYELSQGTRFTLKDDEEKVVYKLHNIDGMYSYCTRASDKEVIHIIAWAEVAAVNV